MSAKWSTTDAMVSVHQMTSRGHYINVTAESTTP